MSGRWLAAFLAVVEAFLTSPALAGDATSEPIIQYGEDRLTVRVTHVAVADILAEIGRQAGVEVRGELGDLGQASTDFESVALPAALHRLLGEHSFALVYGAGGQLRAISVLRGSDATSLGAVPGAASLPPSTVPPAVDHPNPAARWAEVTARHPPVRVSGKLASALGTESAPLRILLNAMISNDDPAVRSEALGASMHVLAYDSDIRTALLGLWPVLDPDTARFRTVSGGPSWRRLLIATVRRAL